MIAKQTKQKPRTKPKKTYTFSVSCTFHTTNSFNESEVVHDTVSGEVYPSDEALQSLGKEIADAIHQQYVVDDFEAYAGPDELLGSDIIG
jgi:hypothetical protein